ncbi:MAG: B-box zinc finger protein, partial [Planctomycetota bacterium]|nr:B-box zinc finger protein [Planctomycetota bacterium]
MIESVSLSVPKVLCKNHEDRAATSSCERCGDFVCAECTRSVRQRGLCPDCIDRYELPDLTTFKINCWGKRDAYVWVLGLSGSLGFGLLFLFVLVMFVLGASGTIVSSGFSPYQQIIIGVLSFLGLGLSLF